LKLLSADIAFELVQSQDLRQRAASGDETKNIPEITLDELAEREQSIKNDVMQHSDACELLAEHLLQTYEDKSLIIKEGVLYEEIWQGKSKVGVTPVSAETQRLFEESGKWFENSHVGKDYIYFTCTYVIVVDGSGVKTFGPINVDYYRQEQIGNENWRIDLPKSQSYWYCYYLGWDSTF